MYNHQDFIDKLENQRDTQTIDRSVRDMGNDVVILACQYVDDVNDFSHYGRFSNTPEAWTVDRKEGVFYGEYQSREYRYKTHSEKLAIARATRRAKKDGFQLDPDSDFCEKYGVDRDGDYFTISFDGYKIVASDLWVYSRYDSRHEYRYFVPEVTPDSPESIGYALQDHKRVERMCNDDWTMTYVTATAYYKGIEIGSDSLGGIESDDNDSWVDTILEDMDIDALRIAHIGKLQEQLDALQA